MPAATREEANAQQRKWYRNPKHKAYQLRKVKERKLVIRKWFWDFKKTLKCPCGEADPRCLDFHHIDPTTKKNLVSVLAWAGSMKSLLAEIEKCEVQCANCHRKKTFKLH